MSVWSTSSVGLELSTSLCKAREARANSTAPLWNRSTNKVSYLKLVNLLRILHYISTKFHKNRILYIFYRIWQIVNSLLENGVHDVILDKLVQW